MIETEKTFKNVTYAFIKPEELRRADIAPEMISAARIDVQTKITKSEYGLFYYNYQNSFNMDVADGDFMIFISRPFVQHRIGKLLNSTTKKGTNEITLEKALSSFDIADFVENCENHFKKVEIRKIHLWEVLKDALPKQNLSKVYESQWFTEMYAPKGL